MIFNNDIDNVKIDSDSSLERSLKYAYNYIVSLIEEIDKYNYISKRAELCFYKSCSTILSRKSEKEVNSFFNYIMVDLYNKDITYSFQTDSILESINIIDSDKKIKEIMRSIVFYFKTIYRDEWEWCFNKVNELIIDINGSEEYGYIKNNLGINNYSIYCSLLSFLLVKTNFKYCVNNYMLLETVEDYNV